MGNLDSLITKHGLDAHAPVIRSLMRPCVAMRATRIAQAELAPTESRLGGLPHLPSGVEWPRWRNVPLVHLATVRLSDASAHDRTRTLPRQGLLWFWYAGDGPWGYDPDERGFMRVTYAPDENVPLSLAEFPMAGEGEPNDELPSGGAYAPCRVAYAAAETLPNWEWIREHAPEHRAMGDLDPYTDLVTELDEANRAPHRLLGHSSLVQGPWELECQLVTNGINCGQRGAYETPRALELAAGARNWRQLLQLDSDDAPGWMWGDTGVLYYAIPEQALAAREFDRSWLVMQCC